MPTRIAALLLLLASCAGEPPADETPDAGDMECRPRVVLPDSCRGDTDCPAGYGCEQVGCLPFCRSTFNSVSPACALPDDRPWSHSNIETAWDCNTKDGDWWPHKITRDWCRGGVRCIVRDRDTSDMRPWYSDENPCLHWKNHAVDRWPFVF